MLNANNKWLYALMRYLKVYEYLMNNHLWIIPEVYFQLYISFSIVLNVNALGGAYTYTDKYAGLCKVIKYI